MFVDVVPDEPVRQPLTYRTTPDTLPYLRVGSLVGIPFGPKQVFGIITRLRRRAPRDLARLKPIGAVYAPSWAPEPTLRLAQALADYTHEPLGTCLFRLLPPPGKQLAAWQTLETATARDGAVGMQRLHACGPRSARMDAYVTLVRNAARTGRQALIALPTAHAADIAGRLTAAGLRVGLVSGQDSPTTQHRTALAARLGDLDVLVGTRHVIGWPMRSLGVLVADDVTNRGHADDQRPYADTATIAVLRAAAEPCRVVLGTALPTLGMARAEQTGAAKRISLAPAPRTITVAHTPRTGVVVPRIAALIDQQASRDLPVAVIAPRSGIGGALDCRSCGWRLTCAHCGQDVQLHEPSQPATCYDCQLATAQPTSCPACGSHDLAQTGIGELSVRQRLAAELGTLPPWLVVGTEQLLEQPQRYRAVVFVHADSPMLSPDLDRPYLFGRAIVEASALADDVIVQTRQPDHPFWGMLAADNGRTVMTSLQRRKAHGLPPFQRQAQLSLPRSADGVALHPDCIVVRRWHQDKRGIMDLRIPTERYDERIRDILGANPRGRVKTDSILHHA